VVIEKIVARGPQKRGALDHGLFGLCVNPSLLTEYSIYFAYEVGIISSYSDIIPNRI